MRLDQQLVKLGLVASRQRAKELIASGQVYVDGKAVLKASWAVLPTSSLEIKGPLLPYPSRAGLKLAKALEIFQVDVQGMTALDVGASTGGFTSCLLQQGARKVYALDVGQDQLVAELKLDPRVVNLEKTNIRTMTAEELSELVDLVTIDVSFISLRLVIPPVLKLLKPTGKIIALIKPQFETGGKGLNKQGVITSKTVHCTYIPPLVEQLQAMGCSLLNFSSSPLAGSKGNIEYLAYFQIGYPSQNKTKLVEKVIDEAWQVRFE